MEITLNEAFNYSPADNVGIFHYLQDLEIPWKDDNIDAYLDLYYHNNHSGNKITSPLIDSFIVEGHISTESKEDLASIIFALYGVTWVRMWNIYTSEYEPLQNYDMTEHKTEGDTLTHGKTSTRTDNLTDTETDNTLETRTPDITNTKTPATTKSTSKSVYGFNSANAEPSEVVSETDGGTESIAETGTETNAKTGTVAIAHTGTQTDVNSGQDVHTSEHTLTRFGNIGVTTSQQMAQSEIDLWKWNFFQNVIFPNIDGVLTIALY